MKKKVFSNSAWRHWNVMGFYFCLISLINSIYFIIFVGLPGNHNLIYGLVQRRRKLIMNLGITLTDIYYLTCAGRNEGHNCGCLRILQKEYKSPMHTTKSYKLQMTFMLRPFRLIQYFITYTIVIVRVVFFKFYNIVDNRVNHANNTKCNSKFKLQSGYRRVDGFSKRQLLQTEISENCFFLFWIMVLFVRQKYILL